MVWAVCEEKNPVCPPKRRPGRPKAPFRAPPGRPRSRSAQRIVTVRKRNRARLVPSIVSRVVDRPTEMLRAEKRRQAAPIGAAWIAKICRPPRYSARRPSLLNLLTSHLRRTNHTQKKTPEVATPAVAHEPPGHDHPGLNALAPTTRICRRAMSWSPCETHRLSPHGTSKSTMRCSVGQSKRAVNISSREAPSNRSISPKWNKATRSRSAALLWNAPRRPRYISSHGLVHRTCNPARPSARSRRSTPYAG